MESKGRKQGKGLDEGIKSIDVLGGAKEVKCSRVRYPWGDKREVNRKKQCILFMQKEGYMYQPAPDSNDVCVCVSCVSLRYSMIMW